LHGIASSILPGQTQEKQMKKRSSYQEPVSIILRRHPHGDKTELTETLLWVTFSALGIFLVLILSALVTGEYLHALAASVGILPIIVSLALIRRNAVSLPSSILAMTIIFLITWLATIGRGIYDIAVLAYPVILIVAGLILRGRVVLYLAILIVLCMGWLVFGAYFQIYEPLYAPQTSLDDFFYGSIIILVAGNAILRLAQNVYSSLSRAEQEIKMREKAELEREATIQQLKRKNQELDRFAIRVSHDLKTPLITLAGFLGYLERDIKAGNEERAVKDFAQIKDAAKTMGKFVDELLDLSRVGRITNPPKDVSFGEIVQDALRTTEGLLEEKQAAVEVDAFFPFVYVDRPRIVQVMQNLIVNAVKFMGDQPDPRIRIGFEEVEGRHVFWVRDNGIGIAPENHERIFELFNKLDPNSDGTGIGLGLVKKIIEVHNVKIWVVSEPGKGSTFKFTLQNEPRIRG
jgi:signal transduction histidine kinase